MTSAEAIGRVDALCGGQAGFTRLYCAIGRPWDENLEAFCLGKITPEQYLTNATKMVLDYQIEKIVVDNRGSK